MTDIQRDFLPGQNWLYLKICCGPKIAENILLEALWPEIKQWYAAGKFSKFFFVRYKETESHLRIRFFNPDPLKNFTLLHDINTILYPYLSDYLISSIQIDTYQREIERYREHMLRAEAVFFLDSMAVLSALSQLPPDDNGRQRLLIALFSVEEYLTGFGLDLSAKLNFSRKQFDAFFREFGNDNDLNKQLNAKYKYFQQDIFSYLSDAATHPSKIAMQERTKRISSITGMDGNFQTILPSVIHMSVNRIFLAKQRLHELLIYHFLYRYYAAKVATFADVAES